MSIAFISGVNSFLGGTLARALIAQGWHVRGLVRADSNTLFIDELPIELVIGDLREPASYRKALAESEALFHVAAQYTHQSARIRSMWEINEGGTRHILAAAVAADIPNILHTSTIGTIGQPTDGSLATEDTPFNLPTPSHYVRSKRAGEQIASELAAEGAPIVIVHPTAILGAGDWRPSSSGRYVLKVLRQQMPPYPAEGINWCPVMDVAEGMIRANLGGQPGRHYILGHRQGNLQRDAFIDLICRGAGIKPPPPPARSWRHTVRSLFKAAATAHGEPESGSGPARLTCWPERAIAELGMPQTDLIAAARAATEWYRINRYI